MILYALACDAGHRFDSWFPQSSAFDALAAAGHLCCPTCGSVRVGKTIMAPAVVGPRRVPPSEIAPSDMPDTPVPPKSTCDVAVVDSKHKNLRALARAFHEKVIAETQDVGPRFPEEARRIHAGEEPERRIRGQATPTEARDLLEDGIMILPLPMPPERMN